MAINKRPRESVLSIAILLVTAVSWSAFAEEVTLNRAEGDIYPLSTCPVSGSTLGEMGTPVVKEYDGREIRFCCDGCIGTFESNKSEYIKKIDNAIIDEQKALYPLDTCVVTGQKLGAMGTPVEYVYKNRLVRFCCAGCIESFLKDPAVYLDKINAAVVDKQKPAYGTDVCIVLNRPLGDDTINYISGNRLIRLCCKGCIKAFEEDPQKYLKILKEKRSTR